MTDSAAHNPASNPSPPNASPPDPTPNRTLKIMRGILGVALIVALAIFGGWVLAFRTGPDPFQAADVAPDERYKYASIGAEAQRGVPYWIWMAMPELFSEYLPGPEGYESLGMVWEANHETPIGFAKRNIGVIPRAGLNCAVCHLGSYRTSETAPRITVPAGSSPRFDLHAYQRFLYDCVSDPRFDGDHLLPVMESLTDLSFLEKAFYRFGIIPLTRKALLEDRDMFFGWKDSKPDPGPGRIDPFNPIKFRRLQQPADDTIGNADIITNWNLKIRQDMVLHWDGTNPDATEVIVSSAIGDGADPSSMDAANLAQMDWLEDYLNEFTPPPYPFPVDVQLAAAGRPIFEQSCAECHAPGQPRTGTVIPIDEVGTDDHRLYMWEQKDATALNALYEDYDWGFQAYRDTDGYAAVPLDGVWLRSPYLHNGSVPSLTDLLKAPGDRPPVFYRGNDVYDPESVGFVATEAQDATTGQPYFEYDVSVPGNSNQGHGWGTELSGSDKQALVEYLKTL